MIGIGDKMSDQKIDLNELKATLEEFKHVVLELREQSEEAEVSAELDHLLQAILRLQGEFQPLTQDGLTPEIIQKNAQDLAYVMMNVQEIAGMDDEDFDDEDCCDEGTCCDETDCEFDDEFESDDLASSFDFGDRELSEEDLRYVEQQVDWIEKFYASSVFMKLTESQQTHANFILHCFVEQTVEYDKPDPSTWDEDLIDDICLSFFPSEISADGELFQDIAPVIASFFTFLGSNKLIDNASDLSKHTKSIEDEIIELSQNPEVWSFMKKIVMSAHEQGIDLEDPEVAQKFIEKFAESHNQ